jgi:hypothetical protein
MTVSRSATPQFRIYDLTPMNTSGTGTPTQIGASVNHPRLQTFLDPKIGRDTFDRTKVCTVEATSNAQGFVLRRWSYNVAGMVQSGSTVNSATLPDAPNYFCSPLGVVYGRLVDMGFSPTDITEVYVVGCREDLYNTAPQTLQKQRNTAYVFNASTGARFPNYDFPLDQSNCSQLFCAQQGSSSGGFSRFYGSSNGDPVSRYTGITWNTESSNWWAGYTWYDSNVTGPPASVTHETNISGLQQFTMTKRARLTVGVPPLPDPAAGAQTPRQVDDVNSFRAYLGRGASNPTRTGMFATPTNPSDLGLSLLVDTMPSFTGTIPPASTNFPSDASAELRSSATGADGLPKFQLKGDGFMHGEALDVSGAGASALTGKAFKQLYYSIRAQSQITGGGIRATDASYNISWSARFIFISLGNDPDLATGGFFQIDMPPTGTVIPGFGAATAKTVTAGKIPLGSWDALWYEIPYGSTGASVPSNFRITNYSSAYVVPNNWVLLCIRNPDAQTVEWATGGNDVDPGYDSDSPLFKQVILNSTADATANAGNKPALRIGNIAGTHLRIDGNEIIAMTADNTQGALLLNGSNTVNVAASGGTANIATGGGTANCGTGSGGQLNCQNFDAVGHVAAGGIVSGSNCTGNNQSGTGTVAANVNAAGTFIRSGSALRMKKNIVPLDASVIDKMLDLEPVRFHWKQEYFTDPDAMPDEFEHGGFIADQALEAGLDLWVSMTEDGQTETFDYQGFTSALLLMCQRLWHRVDELENAKDTHE